jgi:hypothetical protein
MTDAAEQCADSGCGVCMTDVVDLPSQGCGVRPKVPTCIGGSQRGHPHFLSEGSLTVFRVLTLTARMNDSKISGR